MRIVVAYNWAPDPQEAAVGADGGVDWSRAKPGISDYDPVAVEVARRLAEATSGELIGLTAGAKGVGASIACKTALSRGLDRVVVFEDDSLKGAGTAGLAAVLAGAVRHIGDVDVVITGDSSVDVAGKMVPTVLAGQRAWHERPPGCGQEAGRAPGDFRSGHASQECDRDGQGHLAPGPQGPQGPGPRRYRPRCRRGRAGHGTARRRSAMTSRRTRQRSRR